MARKVESSGLVFEAIADLSSHMGLISDALTHFSPRIEGLMTDVIRNDGAGIAEASRATGRLEQVMSEFVEGYQTAKAAHVIDADSKEARTLLLGVYRHHVNVICDWLDDLVSAIKNPLAELNKQSIPVTSGAVLTISLNMTSPPEMAKLEALAERLRQKAEQYIEAELIESPSDGQINKGPGILGSIGALAFGVGIINTVFGRRQR